MVVALLQCSSPTLNPKPKPRDTPIYPATTGITTPAAAAAASSTAASKSDDLLDSWCPLLALFCLRERLEPELFPPCPDPHGD